MNQDNYIPPQSLETEKIILSSLFHNPELIPGTLDFLDASAFYNDKNREIYKAISALDDNGDEVNIVTVVELLKNEITDIDIHVSELIESPSYTGIKGYIKLLNNKSAARKIAEDCQLIQNQAVHESGDVSGAVNLVQGLTTYLEDFCSEKGLKMRRKGKVVLVNDHRQEVETFWQKGFGKIGLEFNDWPKFSKHYRLVPGFLTLINGIPTHGKTTFLDAIIVNSIKDHNWKWLIFSPENKPYYLHIHPLCEKLLKKPFFGSDNVNKVSIGELDHALTTLNQQVKFLDLDENNRTIKAIKQLVKEIMKNEQVNGLVIDPFNKVEVSLKDNENYTNYVKRILRELQYFSRDNNLCTLMVVHPPKLFKNPKTGEYPVPTLYDVDGSAHWYNGTDNGITVYRNFKKKYVEIHIQKIKFKPHGKTGVKLFRFNETNGTYYEISKNDINDNKNDDFIIEEPKHEAEQTEIWQDKF